jgi:hypothetical protein
MGFFQTALQILSHLLDQGGLVIQEVGDASQGGVEMDPLGSQFQIGEAVTIGARWVRLVVTISV